MNSIRNKFFQLFKYYITIPLRVNISSQIPPPPPKPDFDASREKLQKLGEGEGTLTKDEFQKMKKELEA